MKYRCLIVLTLILGFGSQESRGQNLRLITRNPLPRINQEIVLNYFYTESQIENRFEAYINNPRVNDLITGTIEINDSSNTSSEIVVGPITVEYNGRKMKSDSFKVKVFSELPDTNKGIWINQVNIDGSVFLIIEQRIPRTAAREKYASFNREKFIKLNLEPYEFSTYTLSFRANENRIEKSEYTERRTILLLRNSEKLQSDLNINESFFLDLPKNCEPIKLVLNKK